MQAHGGANLAPIAVPDIFWNVSLINSKKLLFNTNSAIFIKSSVGIFFESLLSRVSLRAIRLALSGIHPKVFIFPKNGPSL